MFDLQCKGLHFALVIHYVIETRQVTVYRFFEVNKLSFCDNEYKDCKQIFSLVYTIWVSEIVFIFILFYFIFGGLHLWHMEVPWLGIELELQLPAYATATATKDLSRIFDLHHSSWQRWIPNPARGTREHTCILMDTSQIHFQWPTLGIPKETIIGWITNKSLTV